MLTLASTILVVSAVWVISAVWKFFNWVWLKPRKIEKLLRAQGISGTQYKLLHGDAMDMAAASAQVETKTMELSHRILPRLKSYAHRMVEKYGKVCFFWIGTHPTLVILDSEMIKEALNDKSGHFQQRELHPLVKLVETGIFSYSGEKWIKHKRIISPAFRQERLKLLLPSFQTCCRQMVEKWQNSVTEGSIELDVLPELHNFAADVISRTTFGDNYEEGRRVYQLQMEQAALLMEVAPHMYIPLIEHLPTKRIRRMKEIHREIRVLLTDVIDKRERAMRTGETYTDDLLSLLMESNLKETTGNSKNAGMTTDDIIEECKMFYLAGQETVSLLLTWTMVVLSMHQDWQEKAREEVLHVFGRNAPYFDGLNQLKIVTMILNEVLRLYSPVISMSRDTNQKVKLGEVIVPAGVRVLMPILLIHHDRELWGEDVEEFNPQRFSNGMARAKINEQSFFPFGWGPKSCIGQTFAFVEAKMAMAMILQHFSFELSSTYTHDCVISVFNLLVPRHGGAKLIIRKA